MNQNKKNLLDGNIKPSSSQKNFYNEIRKINKSLILDNIDSCKRFKKKNIFNEKNQSTKSIDNQNSKIFETQRKPLICSGIFDNIKIRKINTNILNNKFTGYIPKMNNTEANMKTLIKVNIKRKKDIYSSSTNITKKNIKPNKKIEIKTNNKNEKNIDIYLYSQRNLNKNNYTTRETERKIKINVNKVKKIIYSHLFRVLKYSLYNVSYYFHFWYNKIHMKIILEKLLLFKKHKRLKNIIKKIPNKIQIKKKNNLSSRENKHYNLGKFQSFGSHKNIIRNKGNDLSSLDNYKGNIIKNVLPQKATSSLSNCNSRKKLYKKNKSSEKECNKYQRHILLKTINKIFRGNLGRKFEGNKINMNSKSKIKTPSNKNPKTFRYKNNIGRVLQKIEISSNNEIPYLNLDKIKEKNIQKTEQYNNKTFRTIFDRNIKNIFLIKDEMINNNINDDIRNITSSRINYGTSSTMKNTNVVQKNKNSKNIFYKIQKFDTCPLSFMCKKKDKSPFLFKSKINKYFVHWINVTFKNKLIKYFTNIRKQIKLRNIIYRKIIRVILDYLQIIILKKYFDEHRNKSIKTNILLKLRAYLLKNNKLKRYIDTSNGENYNYYTIKSGDIINNININNFINYNNTNKIIPPNKTFNIFNNYAHINNIRFPLDFNNSNNMNIDSEYESNKTYKVVKTKSFCPKGILVDQINQLRMVFNLLEKHKQNELNTKDCFLLWKKYTFTNLRKKMNYRKINIVENKRYIAFKNNKKIYSFGERTEYNNNKNDIGSRFNFERTYRLINNVNKKISDDSFDSKNQISEIVYKKKILNPSIKFNNNRYNNDILQRGRALRKINKIEEREIHFTSLSVKKNNTSRKENTLFIKDKLTKSGIKNKISKIKIEFLENPMAKKNTKTKNKINKKINYDNLFNKIKKSFVKISRKLDYENVNQTFYCQSTKNQDEF